MQKQYERKYKEKVCGSRMYAEKCFPVRCIARPFAVDMNVEMPMEMQVSLQMRLNVGYVPEP